MTVGQLKALLAGCDDDLSIVCPGFDHSYRVVSAKVGTALRNDCGEWTEDYGEDMTPQADFGKRKKVIIVGE